MKITGRDDPDALRRCRNSIPESPPRSMSRRRQSTCFTASPSRNASAESKARTSKPCASNKFRMASRVPGSSSTIAMTFRLVGNEISDMRLQSRRPRVGVGISDAADYVRAGKSCVLYIGAGPVRHGTCTVTACRRYPLYASGDACSKPGRSAITEGSASDCTRPRGAASGCTALPDIRSS